MYSFLHTNAERQMAEVEFLQFAGKIKVMLNLQCKWDKGELYYL